MEHLDSDCIFSQIQDSAPLGLFSDDLIGRISSDFSGLTWLQLDEIPVSFLFHILSHNLLMISSEDDLFSYISSHLDLLQFVRCEYLSVECVCDFFSALPDSIYRRLWDTISRRLISHLTHEVEFPLKEAKSLEGIIFDLTRKHGGNVHDKGIVTITSKSVEYHEPEYEDEYNPRYARNDPPYGVRNAADFTSHRYFCSNGEPDQWICWDFHDLRVRPTHYTIQTNDLKSWVGESSPDGEVWTEIDRKTDNMDFEAGWVTLSFAVSNSSECRFIRLTQTGKAHS
jgi:hypothetical protein